MRIKYTLQIKQWQENKQGPEVRAADETKSTKGPCLSSHSWDDSTATKQSPILVCICMAVLSFTLGSLNFFPKLLAFCRDSQRTRRLFLPVLAVLCQKQTFKHQSPFVLLTGQSPQVGYDRSQWFILDFLSKDSDLTAFWIATRYKKSKQILHCTDLTAHFQNVLGNLISFRLLNCWPSFQEGSAVSWVL